MNYEFVIMKVDTYPKTESLQNYLGLEFAAKKIGRLGGGQLKMRIIKPADMDALQVGRSFILSLTPYDAAGHETGCPPAESGEREKEKTSPPLVSSPPLRKENDETI
jgi:hypothetical protein